MSNTILDMVRSGTKEAFHTDTDRIQRRMVAPKDRWTSCDTTHGGLRTPIRGRFGYRNVEDLGTLYSGQRQRENKHPDGLTVAPYRESRTPDAMNPKVSGDDGSYFFQAMRSGYHGIHHGRRRQPLLPHPGGKGLPHTPSRTMT